MEPGKSAAFAFLADAFCYPSPGQLSALDDALNELPEGSEKLAARGFLQKIRLLSLGAWEELHTHILDLNPPAAPYIGFQTWGESYQRGVFLAKMNRALWEAGVDLEGELADHLIPVLRYLARTDQPLPELMEVLNPALHRMEVVLRKADSNNPYLDLLQAVQALCKSLKQEAV